ncbi:MAG: UTP--glucose-1-phosphate uridylyltransferase, partial [Planctomycetota bacterium]
MNRDTLIRRLERTGQEAVARHLEQLDPPARERLEAQLAGFDYALVERLASVAKAGGPPGTVGEFEPAPVVPLRRPPEEIDAARRAGEEAIRAGTVAAFVVAGGQGSRLGYDGPKGCYPIGPLSGKSLFQIHAEKVLAAGRRYGADIPLYVMTSGTNDAAVRRFFEQNDHFGLAARDVFFCRQRMIPAFDQSGRFLLEAPDRVFVNPDGHGGSYHALSASGAFDHMAGRGIERISYFQVDNPLVPAVDPLFVGEHVRRGSEMSSKVLEKRDALEKLGVFGYVDGELRVVEYSDMSEELQRRRRPDGSLRYRYGSIAVHVI